ncbi:TfoX/Sxy family protein [Pontibacter sp. JH31]|uniref:TfoX/Sxy family protein n=1 Tax=Pontibacter aquaedesilientis TaxID=2766980 RepID=A0ABR7XKJ1_9BACT|nr:TfoX/Sxy family protein [Pontibacter aquaedesilientis]
MASDQNFVDFVLEQIKNAGEITPRKMFGEYGTYSDEKLFGLICDNKLFLKPTSYETPQEVPDSTADPRALCDTEECLWAIPRTCKGCTYLRHQS